jgi:hypothetical protein
VKVSSGGWGGGLKKFHAAWFGGNKGVFNQALSMAGKENQRRKGDETLI